jgi:phage terminase large subunit-like protein
VNLPIDTVQLSRMVTEAQIILQRRLREQKLAEYRPYPKQLEFHNMSRLKRERLFRAGNQLGKTISGGVEAAFHLTGLYPDWWQGRRIEQASRGWVGAPSGEMVRDGAQRVLLGPQGCPGQGMIPKSSIIETHPARGISGLIDSVSIRHVSGGVSHVKFKSYDQGREKWQTETLDFVWFDEEPPEDIYTEGLTRTNATNGFVWMTFTPLLGMSNVVMRFLRDPGPDRGDVRMEIEDALHISEDVRATIIASYLPHEVDARTRGIPILGSGRIYPIPRSLIAVDPMPIPPFWPIIAGIDFGWNHPTAAAKIAWDRDTDTVYVVAEYRRKEAAVLEHAAALRHWDCLFAWPQDALQHDKASGDQIGQLYRENGLDMCLEHAQFEDNRRNGVEAGIWDILDRMQSNRFRVFSHLTNWFEEFDQYHRDDGRVAKIGDDLMDATRYAVMMLREAQCKRRLRDPYAPRPGQRRSGSQWSR